MDFDALLIELGEFGKYQKRWFYICMLPISVFAAFNNMSVVFLAASPSHWCRTPSLDHLHLSQDTIANLTLPPQAGRAPRRGVNGCNRYDRRYANWTLEDVAVAMATGPSDGVGVTECGDGWEYDSSVYQSTIVTEVRRVNRMLIMIR